jgi:hypothetical protein
VEDGLGLSTETHLLRVVTTLSLGEVGGLSRLVLGNLVNLVLTALFAGAVSLTFLGYVNHFEAIEIRCRGQVRNNDRKMHP